MTKCGEMLKDLKKTMAVLLENLMDRVNRLENQLKFLHANTSRASVAVPELPGIITVPSHNSHIAAAITANMIIEKPVNAKG
jgi:Domain of unknown function (DUF4525)